MGHQIVFTGDDPDGDFKAGERGIVQGFVRGYNDRAYIVVLKDDRFLLASYHLVKVV